MQTTTSRLRAFLTACLLLATTTGVANAQDAAEANWWTNRTSSNNVDQVTLGGEGEYLRLGNGLTGFLEGDIPLPGPLVDAHEVVYGVTAGPNGMASSDRVRVYFAHGLIWEFSGLGPGETAIEDFTAVAVSPVTDSIPYRVEFDCADPAAASHPTFLRGRLMRRAWAVTLGTPRCGLAPNSVGSGVALLATGGKSVAANDFTLRSSGGPPGSFALHMYSQGSQVLPFGTGYLCVGGPGNPIVRLGPAQLFNASGHTNRAVDFTAPPVPGGQILAGSTWFFQLWYRDVHAGNAFNLSESLQVKFTQ